MCFMDNKKIQIKKKYVLVAIATGTDTFVSEIIDFTGKNEEKIRDDCGLWYSRNINRDYCEKPWRYFYVLNSLESAQKYQSNLLRTKNETRFTKKRKVAMLWQLVLLFCLNLITVRLLILGEKELSLLPCSGAVLTFLSLFETLAYSQTQSGAFKEEIRNFRSNEIN